MTIKQISDYPMPSISNYPTNKVDWQIDAERAVLLIHDMQAYFLSFYDPKGPLIATVIQNLKRLREWAYANNVPVVYTAQPYEQSDEDRALLNAMWGQGLSASTADQQLIIDQLTPNENDVILTKWRYSAFSRSDLRERMQGWNRDQLIVGGVYAHIGCMITSVDAFMNDIQPFLVGDAVADFSEEEHHMALKYVSSRCGKVVDVDSLVHADDQGITQEWLYAKVQQLIEEDEELDPDESLIVYGLDSLKIMQFASDLKANGIAISFEEIARNPTLSNWWAMVQDRQINTSAAKEAPVSVLDL
ncbi:isochorismatase family protein [Marinomonas rhizomae]|uniref:isochorismatase n=1 Tax=Marinomonas rhizomae TaxID=491948 RepID=A0A366JIY6_9GAMM|nr:isochorismatase family protein [Marinomonas rhizomae]RBP85788.1 bifunctional isochorismate lyase/aryl carrier protein [Marinomonas rhizomae]RNF75594.1 isochorismatase family protein [Marinomonas rhizomae]